MKTLKVKSILFSLLAIIAVAVFMTSCERESIVEEDLDGWRTSPLDNIDDELAELMAEEQEVAVEYATLEEINRAMEEHGLEPFSQEDLEGAIQLRMVWPCSFFNILGDWDRSGSLTTFDLVLAQQYLCNFPFVGCSGNLHITSNNFPDSVMKFRLMSYLAYGIGSGLLGQNDIIAARQYILGMIVCG